MGKMRMFLWIGICVLFMGYAATVQAADVSDFTQAESYATMSIRDMWNSHVLTFDQPDQVTVTDNEEQKGILLTGNSSVINGERFRINKTFHFDGKDVGRLSVDALAGKGENLTMEFYLDDETESFASVTLQKQGREDSWSKDVCLQTDVIEKEISGSHVISFTVENADEGKTEVLLRSVEFIESGLPVVYMNIDESLGTIAAMHADVNHKTECYGDMTVEVPKDYTYEFGDNTDTPTTEVSTTDYTIAYLRGRGNSTWEAAKKPYRLKIEKKRSILGMGANKNWVLLANYMEKSRLRNQITYWMGRQLGMEFTPKCVSVDLVMNGVYYGTYLLSEQVRVDENRVAIDDLEADEDTKAATDLPTISGGYLLSLYAHGADEGLTTFETKKGMKFSVESPSFEGYSNEAQLNYISDYFQKTENAIFGEDYKDEEGKSYTDYMDLDSTVDYLWMQEITSNGDAYGTDSTYLYKKREGKLYWGPLWDYDIGWSLEATEGFMDIDSVWIKQLQCDTTFINAMTERWPAVKEKLVDLYKDGGQIDQYYDQMEASMRYEDEKWAVYSSDGDDGDESEDSESEPTNFYEEKEQLKSIVKARTLWIDSHLDELAQKPCKLTFKADGKTYCTLEVLRDEEIGTVPTAPSKKGYIFDGWIYETSEGDMYLAATDTFTSDTTITAHYLSEKTYIAPKNLYLKDSEMWIDLEDKDSSDEKSVICSVYPQNAYARIQYSSSNQDIITVNEEGTIEMHKTGDAVVTVSAGNLKKTCTVHVYDSAKTTIEEANISLKQTAITLKKGQWTQLTITYDKKQHTDEEYSWTSLNSSVASVDSCGVVLAKKAGTTYIVLRNQDKGLLKKCKVTVPEPASTIKKGTVYTYKGLKYKVTYKAKKGGNVKVTGPTKKTLKKCVIPSMIKIKGETFKVTAISAKAFYKCKKLRRITLGKNIKSIGKKAFTKIYKKAVFKVPSSKKKAYKKLLTSKKGFRKTMKIK